MKKIFLLLVLFTHALFAEVQNVYMSKELLEQNIPLVDIRTEGEWRETGLLKGAIPIVFFSERGEPLIEPFLSQLNQKVDTRKPFAIICHVGSRTSVVAPWLSKELGYHVINIKGGMEYATKGLKLPTYPYKPSN